MGEEYFHELYHIFVDASSHLYKRVCRSVGRSVRRSVYNTFEIDFESAEMVMDGIEVIKKRQ